MIRSVPIYDYRCDHCGHVFSAVRSFSEGPVEKCPSCGLRPRRLIVAPAIVFKGGGWYKTDSRGAAPSEGETATPSSGAEKGDKTKQTKQTEKTEKSDKKPETKTDTKGETKAETKAETKTDAKPSGDTSAKSEPKS